MVAVQFELFGEAFIWKNRGINENGEPLELHVLPTNYVDVVPDPQDVWGVLGYVFKVSGLDMGLRKEDVIHWKKTNPNFDAVTMEHLRGQSPLKAGLKILQQDLDITDASVAMYQNGGARGVLFNKSFNIDLSPEQQTQLKNVIDRKLNAGAVKGAIATLQGDWGYADFGLSSTDMELLKASNLTTEKLCNLFNVPPEMFVAGQTYENKNQARKDFLTNKIAPMCAAFDDELNRSLQKDFKTGTVINTEFDNEPELQEDISKLIEYSTKLFDRGVITGNEFRKLTNYDETTEPMHNTFLITGNYTPLQDLDLSNQEALMDSYDADREAAR
jgi:HK97 family phage portal protein